jgi:hypothetical protein
VTYSRHKSSVFEVNGFRLLGWLRRYERASSETVRNKETWSLTLREERRLRVFENRVLRRIFGPRRVEVTWEWRKLHDDELNGLYSSPNVVRVIKSRRIRWVGHVARMDERKGLYRVFGGET